MVGGFTARRASVVARRASASDVLVIEARTGERHSVGVAAFARGIGDNMRGWFALRLPTVVAVCAGAVGFFVIVAGLVPAGDGMAGRAVVGCRQMRHRLAGGLRAVMTDGAGARCALEAASLVAGFAVDAGVFTGQRKPRCGVIKTCECLLRGRGGSTASDHAEQQKQERDCPPRHVHQSPD